MTAKQLIARLRKAGCRIHVYTDSQVIALTKNEKIVADLTARGARARGYTRNPGGVRSLGEEPLVEYELVLRPGLTGVTGPGGEPVTLDDLMEAAR